MTRDQMIEYLREKLTADTWPDDLCKIVPELPSRWVWASNSLEAYKICIDNSVRDWANTRIRKCDVFPPTTKLREFIGHVVEPTVNIKPVTVYETPDGSRFDTKEEAAKSLRNNQLCGLLNDGGFTECFLEKLCNEADEIKRIADEYREAVKDV